VRQRAALPCADGLPASAAASAALSTAALSWSICLPMFEPSTPPPAQALYVTGTRLVQSERAADVAEGVRLLQQAAAGRHADAAALLAVLSGLGVGMQRRWDLALDHLQCAAEQGSASARGQLHVLARSAVTTGSAAADAATWQRLRQSVDLAAWLSRPQRTLLSTSPRIVAIPQFASSAVCDWLIARAADRVQRALVYDAAAVAGRLVSERSNRSFEFGLLDLDLVVLLVRARIAATLGVPVEVFEPPQVMRYEVGEEFTPHHDYLDPRAHAAVLAAAGQRVATVLVYLNADYAGGETEFPQLGLRHRGGAGDALYFINVDAHNVPDPRTLHAGRPPTRGVKWLLSQWVRDWQRH
jgi:prolyl 4-hydroxylase